MSFEVLKNEKNVADVKITISQEAFAEGIEKAYRKMKNNFKVDGFRKGKVPKSIIEQRYGKAIFYEDALDEAFPQAYEECVKESNFQPVATPVLLSIDDISDEGATVTVQISLKPEFEMPEYKGIKIGSLKYTPKKADVDKAIDEMLQRNARMLTLEEGICQNGDIVDIDFEGFTDGVAFPGGKGEKYPLELGSHSFIEGFEEQLVGKSVPCETEVNVKFPDDYAASELAGKPAMFKVTIHDIKRKELPALDDEFAVDLGFDNLEALTKEAKADVKKTHENKLRNEAEEKLLNTLIENAVIDIPPQYLKEKKEEIKGEFEERIKRQTGIDAETYYKYVAESSGNDDPEQFDKNYEQQAIREISAQLIMAKIVENEKIEASEEEIEAEINTMVEAYAQSREDVEKSMGDYLKMYAHNTVINKKIYDFLVENADTSK